MWAFNMTYEQLISEAFKTNRLLRHKQAENRRLQEQKKQYDDLVQNLIQDIKTNLAPELKMFHNSKVNISKRGGGGGQAMRNFMETKNAVQNAIDNCGFSEIQQHPNNHNNRISRFEYKKNDKTHPGIIIHFKLRSGLGRIINIIVQTQQQSGGASSKSAFYVETMAHIDEQLFL